MMAKEAVRVPVLMALSIRRRNRLMQEMKEDHRERVSSSRISAVSSAKVCGGENKRKGQGTDLPVSLNEVRLRYRTKMSEHAMTISTAAAQLRNGKI